MISVVYGPRNMAKLLGGNDRTSNILKRFPVLHIIILLIQSKNAFKNPRELFSGSYCYE
jgi:hypothetical protein